uniref:Uncharacterized protein n=1 Tax=Molossus molossus TaxID=27622 RepID=A0A7J8HIA6_MOLMO|nr:hypothetical protein HJG59_011007 [Molossus molossus]
MESVSLTVFYGPRKLLFCCFFPSICLCYSCNSSLVLGDGLCSFRSLRRHFLIFYFFFQCPVVFSEPGLLLLSLSLLLVIIYFFATVVNGIFSLVSLSVSSLLVYKYVISFLLLILYSPTLPTLFIKSSTFLMECLLCSMYNFMSSVNNSTFTSSFPIWFPFILSSCLIAVTKTFSTMLNKIGESGHSCLVSVLKKNAFSFCPWV